MKNPYTKEELDILTNPFLSDFEVATKINRNENAIHQKRLRIVREEKRKDRLIQRRAEVEEKKWVSMRVNQSHNKEDIKKKKGRPRKKQRKSLINPKRNLVPITTHDLSEPSIPLEFRTPKELHIEPVLFKINGVTLLVNKKLNEVTIKF
tara:strand:- start:2471 stop:2920 length:450 start_codon:yes stop_codon:yes gene_type:complete